MAPKPKGNEIQLFGHAAETIPCPFGEPMPSLPTNFCLVSPSGGGKTVVLQNLLLKFYKGTFARIWFFSPSIFLDPQYGPIKKYIEKMSDQDREPLMFEEMDQSALGRILHDQRRICEECRKRKQPIPQCAVVLDDFADQGHILQARRGASSGGSHLVTLAVRGRHFGITWIITSQVLNLLGTVIRKNCRAMRVWRLRNHKEVETLCEELSGVYDAKTVMELYRYATEEPYSSLYQARCKDEARSFLLEVRISPRP